MFAESGASVVLADLDRDLVAKEAERIVGDSGTAIGLAWKEAAGSIDDWSGRPAMPTGDKSKDDSS
jgi:hypothetical protein